MIATNRLFSALLLTIFIFLSSRTFGVSLADAVKNKWVTATIRGFDYRKDAVYRASFYGACLVITCKNLRSVPIEISEVPGRFFIPEDSSVQRMVSTAAIAFTLGAQKESTFPIYAMCTEATDGPPGAESLFRTGSMAPPELLSLVNFIAAHHFQNDAAQQTIWCITDNHSPYQISSDDTLISNQLRHYVCGLTGVKYEKDVASPKASPLFRIVDGSFTYTIQKSKQVDLIIYNEAGQEIKELVTNESQAAGSYTYTYHFNLPINEGTLLTQALVIKFFLNGEMIAEKKHVLGDR